MEKTSFLVAFELITAEKNEDEAFAAISLNPAVSWAKFILLDNLPNANRQRVAEAEFNNIIKTGIFMPIKMAIGGINDGHDESIPLGVITHLKQVNNQIHGLAALWERERPEDVNFIKERYKNGEQLQLSWEILYSESALSEDGVTDLLGTTLRAVTLVGMPAYEGRTPIVAVASTDDTTKENDSNKMEELEKLTARVSELEVTVTEKDKTIEELTTELSGLREFKSSVESERAKTEKLVSIKKRFKDADIEKDAEYFVENAEKLLALSDENLDFMIQEMISFSSKKEDKKEGKSSKTDVPPVTGGSSPTLEDLATYLKTRKNR